MQPVGISSALSDQHYHSRPAFVPQQRHSFCPDCFCPSLSQTKAKQRNYTKFGKTLLKHTNPWFCAITAIICTLNPEKCISNNRWVIKSPEKRTKVYKIAFHRPLFITGTSKEGVGEEREVRDWERNEDGERIMARNNSWEREGGEVPGRHWAVKHAEGIPLCNRDSFVSAVCHWNRCYSRCWQRALAEQGGWEGVRV